MKRTKLHVTMLALTALSLLLSACGSSASNESVIATSVALTVQAQDVPTTAPATAAPTETPAVLGSPIPTLTSPPATPTTNPNAGSDASCASASFVDETIPDGTIFKPGDVFMKTWRVVNTSNCTWTTSYKIIFWDGDLLGGAYVYNFPQSVTPGQTVSLTIQLTAPLETGSYKGEWKLQTPSGVSFGVSETNTPIWADIVVSTDNKPDYGITTVTYRLVRDPLSGCVTNVRYTVYANISVSGKTDAVVQWVHSDGFTDKVKLHFDGAGSKEISDTWSFHLGSSTGDKWIQLLSLEPTQQDFGKVKFTYDCK